MVNGFWFFSDNGCLVPLVLPRSPGTTAEGEVRDVLPLNNILAVEKWDEDQTPFSTVNGFYNERTVTVIQRSNL